MKIRMICFSRKGWETAEKLKTVLQEADTVLLDKKSRYLKGSIRENVSEWAEKAFRDSDALIFVGSCGIAVRSIAPHIRDKRTDPAVLVCDEAGCFVIPLLSGHLGGANDLAKRTARILGAVPVITTASDLCGAFAADVFAKRNHAAVFGMKEAKDVTAAVLSGEAAGFYTDFPWEGPLPEGLFLCGGQEERLPDAGVAVTIRKDRKPFPRTVQVIPPVLVLGIGCRRGIEPGTVRSAADDFLERHGFFREAVTKIASIDLKKQEPALTALAAEFEVPFETFSAEMLRNAEGIFSSSAFVEEITGVDNVCERSAVLCSGGTLLVPKEAACGVTLAAAVRDWRIRF